MKKGYLLLIAFLLSLNVQAQDSTPMQPAVNCDNISYNYSDLIIYYYGKYDDDSLQMVMNEWDSLCGMSEPLMSFKVLYAIEQGAFSEDMYGDDIYDYLMLYEKHAEGNNEDGVLYNLPPDYYTYLQSVAKNLKKLELSPVEKVLVDFYASHDEDVLEEMDTTMAATKLYQSYTSYKEALYKITGRFHMSVFGGAWVPDGKIDVLGTHPMLGFQIGSQWQKVSFDLHLSFRFLNAAKKYEVLHNGVLVDSKYYFAVLGGVDAGYKVVQKGKHMVNLLGGIGYKATTLVQNSDEEGRAVHRYSLT